MTQMVQRLQDDHRGARPRPTAALSGRPFPESLVADAADVKGVDYRVSLGRAWLGGGETCEGMVYLLPPGNPPVVDPSVEVGGGLPLWFLARSALLAKGARRLGEVVPASRRNLRAWARAVVPLQVNVEVSELGTFLVGKFSLPRGIWVHHLFTARGGELVPGRVEGIHRVGEPLPGPAGLSRRSVMFSLSLAEEEANPPRS